MSDSAVSICVLKGILIDPDLKSICPPLTEDEFVIARTKHFIRRRSNEMSVYCKECGLNDVHFHTLRHSFATRFVEIGCDIKSLSEILSHSND